MTTRANASRVGCPNILFLFFSEEASSRPPILCRSVWRAGRFQNLFLKRPKKHTARELSRKAPDSLGAELLIASTALRAYRNRHLGTLMRCCEAWEPVGNCFDPNSLECIEVQKLSQIVANLTRENLEEREAEIMNLPWTPTEKDNALASCRNGQRAWRTKKCALP